MALEQQINKWMLPSILLLLLSCGTIKQTKDIFEKNKEKILHVSDRLSSGLQLDDEFVISAFKDEVEVSCKLVQSNNVTFSFDKKNLEYLGITVDSNIVFSNKEKFNYLKKKITDHEFRKNVGTLLNIGVKGIKVKKDWVFITIGVKGIKLKNPDVLNGILVTKNSDVTYQSNYIETFYDNVYLYDLVL